MHGNRGDLAEFGRKNATQIMIFFPHYMWAENEKETQGCSGVLSMNKAQKKTN